MKTAVKEESCTNFESITLERINSSYEDLVSSKLNLSAICTEEYRCRLEELLLLWCHCKNISFRDACTHFSIPYEEIVNKDCENSWEKFDEEIKSLMHSLLFWPKDPKTTAIDSKIWYHRIDEAFLIISRFMDLSFVNTCKRYRVNYDQLQKLRDNKDRDFFTSFRIDNATFARRIDDDY